MVILTNGTASVTCSPRGWDKVSIFIQICRTPKGVTREGSRETATYVAIATNKGKCTGGFLLKCSTLHSAQFFC